MADAASRALDREILCFIKKYAERRAPDAAFNKLALELFSFQYRHNPHYRKFCVVGGKPPSDVRHWREIPAMPSAGFKELVLAAFPAKHAVRVFKTSGTTAGSTGAHFFDSLRLYEAAAVCSFRRYLLPDAPRAEFFYLIHTSKDAPHSSLSFMVQVLDKKYAKGRGRTYIKGSEVHFAKLARDLRACRKPAVILSTAFSLESFLEWLAEQEIRLTLPAGSRLMETGGFKGRVKEISKDRLTKKCGRYLGIPSAYCVSEYGMTELSSQFYDTTLKDGVFGIRRKPFKEGPSWTRVLVMDPRTGKAAKKGELGVLRIFDLANRGSVAAVQTEDLGRERGEGFELVGRAKGSQLRGCSLSYEEFLSS